MLSTLALHPRIHLVASVDSIHAPLPRSSAEIAAGKHTHRHPTTTEKHGGAGAGAGAGEVPSARGYGGCFTT